MNSLRIGPVGVEGKFLVFLILIVLRIISGKNLIDCKLAA